METFDNDINDKMSSNLPVLDSPSQSESKMEHEETTGKNNFFIAEFKKLNQQMAN